MESKIRRIGRKDRPIPQEGPILKLAPNTVIDGLSNTIQSRIITELEATPHKNPSLAEIGRAQVLSVIGDIIDRVSHPDLLSEGPRYKKAVQKTVRYMRFVGFQPQELSAENIALQAQSTTGVPGTENIIYFPTSERKTITPEQIADMERREQELMDERGYGDSAYRTAVYTLLDRMMDTYEIFPQYSLALDLEIEDEAVRIQEEMSAHT